MGIYIRKSLRVGPFRFNLSKSGVGISVGVKGFRLGTGPRGNYVHMGVGGLYYRSTRDSPKFNSKAQLVEQPRELYPEQYSNVGVEQMRPIQDVEISQIVDATSEDLIDELREKHRKVLSWPFAAVFLAVGVSKLNEMQIPSWLMIVTYIFALTVVGGLFYWDKLRKTVVLFYDFDEQMRKVCELLNESVFLLSKAKRLWYTETSARVLDPKYHAGAGNLVDRNPAKVKTSTPPNVKTNIEIISIEFGKQVLYFFPDHLLIYEGKKVGAIGYAQLSIDVGTMRFIEKESVPSDAEIVDRTWQYVNKSGGPDKRFKDNRKLPVCRYEGVSFLSDLGLHKKLIISSVGNGRYIQQAVSVLAKKIK